MSASDLARALRVFVTQAKQYCESTGHKHVGATMHGCCDSLCDAIADGESALAAHDAPAPGRQGEVVAYLIEWFKPNWQGLTRDVSFFKCSADAGKVTPLYK